MNGQTIAAIIGILASLVLVSQNSALTRLGFSKKAILAVVWVAIIVLVVAIMSQIDKPAPPGI